MSQQIVYAGQTFTFKQLLGAGGNGSVVRVYCEKSSMNLAMKVQKKSKDATDSSDLFIMEEFCLFAGLRHPNIINVYSMVMTPVTGMLMEMGTCSLRCWLREHTLEEPDAARLRKPISLQLLSGLKYLHGKQLLHGDGKPENVILFGTGLTDLLAKWADFGLMRQFTEGGLGIRVLGKSLYTGPYRPVELLAGHSKQAGGLSLALAFHDGSHVVCFFVCLFVRLSHDPRRFVLDLEPTSTLTAGSCTTCLRQMEAWALYLTRASLWTWTWNSQAKASWRRQSNAWQGVFQLAPAYVL